MNLNVFELGITGSFGNTQLRQLITPTRDVRAAYIRAHLFKHLAPAGSVYIQIQDANGRKIKDSNSVTITDITAQNYYHGYVRFALEFTFKAERTYYLALKSSGYSYSAIAFIGWCNGFDLKKYGTSYTTPSIVGVNAPLDFDVWEYKTVSKGEY